MRIRLAATAMFVAVLLGTAHAQPAPGGGGPPAVGVARAEKRAVTETSEFVGRIQAVSRVDIVARVMAFLEKRWFTEGAEVKAGDLLYSLEKAPFEAQVAAQAAAVAQAEATLQNNTINLGRAQALIHTPAGQQSRVDEAIAAQRTAQAQVAAAQAQLRLAQVNLSYTDIKAPIDGKISRTLVTEGNVVGPSTGVLATIVSQDPMYVLFPVSVRTGLDLRDRYADKGGFSAVKIKLRLPNGQTYGETGELNYVDNTVAQSTDTVTLRAVIANPVRPGMKPGDQGARELTDGEFVTVLLQGVEPIQAIAIPRAAILSDQQGNYIWVVGPDNKVEQRRVQLGQSTPDTAVIASGLKEGEMVVVDGVQRVRPGITVTPGPAAPGPGIPPTASRT
jgi:membrane fusion protein (multidrug efflux system)